MATIENGERRSYTVKEGDVFVAPAGVVTYLANGPAVAQRAQRHRRRLQREPARHLHHRRAQLILRHTIGLLDFSQELRGFQTVTCHQVRPVFLGILAGFGVSVSSGWFACSWIQAVVTNLDNAHIRSGTQACPGH